VSDPTSPQEAWEKLPVVLSAAQGPGHPWVSVLGRGPMAVPAIFSPALKPGLVEEF